MRLYLNNINIIGMGGHTRSTINLIVNKYPDYKIEIYDDNYDINVREDVLGFNLVGKIKDIHPEKNIFLSLGDNKKRRQLYLQFSTDIINENLVHKNSIIESNILIGLSNQIFANTYINNYSVIGNNNIINTNAIIEHECKIGSHNHISIGAIMCGRSSIGDNCYLGAGSIVIDKINICNDVIIGAGCIVNRNITKPGTYVGVPARKIK